MPHQLSIRLYTGPFLNEIIKEVYLWDEPMPPSTALKLSLPAFGNHDIAYEEVDLDPAEVTSFQCSGSRAALINLISAKLGCFFSVAYHVS